MKPIREPSQNQEPEWDSFGIQATDFRPTFDGDLINVFSTIRPMPDKDQTKQLAVGCARQLASWILSGRKQFNPGDRFQIIIGWPKDVRATDRQIIKTGGDFAQVESIVSGSTEIQMRGDWAATVFEPTHGEQAHYSPRN